MVTDKKEVRLRVREVFGITKMYPDNGNAEIFCDFAKVKTLTSKGVQCILDLGFKVTSDRSNFDPLNVKGINYLTRKKKVKA